MALTRLFERDYELYTIKPDGTDSQRLTNVPGNDAHCAWSPDGEWLAFTSARGGFKDEAALHPGNPQPYGDIYVMRADGTDVRQLTTTNLLPSVGLRVRFRSSKRSTLEAMPNDELRVY